MAFDRKRFLGLTVVEFSSSIGWNDEGSSVNIKLAPEDGESLTNAEIGGVQEFELGAFKFTGFLDRILERHDSGGIFFETILNDGKEHLRKIECVISNLYGSTDPSEDNPVPNYLNIFRYFERNSYGASGANDSGIKPSKFVEGALALINQYGIVANDGKKYGIDFGDIADDLPEFYRIPGPTINLLEAVSLMCEDSGKLWSVKLTGNTFQITTKKMKRGIADVGGVIKTKAQNKNVISWDVGRESANGILSNLVVFGGAKENSVQFNYKSPGFPFQNFWGYDIDGVPCLSKDYQPRSFSNPRTGTTLTIETMDVELPALGIEDIVLGNRYRTNTLELMCVMGSQEAWEFYLELGWPSGVPYSQVFLRAPRDWNIDRIYWTNFGGSAGFPLRRYFSEKENDVGVRRAARLYAYLKNMCEAYWGKQFFVEVNWENGGLGGYFGNGTNPNKVGGLTARNKLEKKDAQDLGDPKETWNIVPSNTGWVDPAYPILEIPKEVWDGFFKDPNGKAYNWIRFGAQKGRYNIDDSGSDIYTTNNSVYVKGSVTENIVEKKYVHVSLPQALYYMPEENQRSELGWDGVSRALFGILTNITNIGTSGLFKVGFPAFSPAQMLLGFKSTTNDVYGPWYSNNGSSGATRIQQNSGLTPWDLGSGANLAKAFEETLKDIDPVASIETGSLTAVEKPTLTIGDFLSGSSGAIVTSISANYGPGGITTRYSLRTFTGRYGVTSKYVIDRLKKQAIKQNEDRRNIYIGYMKSIAKQQAAFRTEMGAKILNFFLNFLNRRHDRMSPHTIFLLGMGAANAGIGAAGGGGIYSRSKQLSSTTKYTEAPRDISKLVLDFIDTPNKSAASIDTLFTPFSNSYTAISGLPKLGRILAPVVAYQSFTNSLDETYQRKADGKIDPRQGKIPTAITYNPYKRFVYYDCLIDKNVNYWDNHNEPLNYQTAYQAGQVGSNVLNVNGVALTGPVMLSGWGIDLWSGQITPNTSGYGLTNKFFPGTTSKGNTLYATTPWEGAELKRTGPVDLIWDSARGVWTSHDVVRVKPYNKIKPTNPTYNPAARITDGAAFIYVNDFMEGSDVIQIYNLSSKAQPAGLETLAHYSVYDNRWYIKGEGCHPRFWDLKTVKSIYESLKIDISKPGSNLNNPDSALPFYIDFVVQESVGDPYTEVVAQDDQGNAIRAGEHFCVDLIQTSGFSGPYTIKVGESTCPSGSKVNNYEALWFYHGLFKEVLKWNGVCPTTPPSTNCWLYKDPETGCHFCSSENISPFEQPVELVDPSPFENCEDCQGVIPSYDQASGCECPIDKEKDPEFVIDSYEDTGCLFCAPTGKNVCSDYFGQSLDICEQQADDYNQSYGPPCFYGTTTTSTTPPPLCYLYFDEQSGCWQCSQNPEGDPDLLDGYSTCEECTDVARERNVEIDNPDCNTTTSTTTTTSDPNTTTSTTPLPTTTPQPTTTLPPGCIEVVDNVWCDADGNIDFSTVLVKACNAPLVAQQSNIMEVRLLRAEVKALTRKLMDIVEVLQSNNIKVFK